MKSLVHDERGDDDEGKKKSLVKKSSCKQDEEGEDTERTTDTVESSMSALSVNDNDEADNNNNNNVSKEEMIRREVLRLLPGSPTDPIYDGDNEPLQLKDAPFYCVNCDTESEDKRMRRCTQCKCVYYCSIDCQRQHWAAGHKKCCNDIKRKQAKLEREENRPKHAKYLVRNDDGRVTIDTTQLFPLDSKLGALLALIDYIVARKDVADAKCALAFEYDLKQVFENDVLPEYLELLRIEPFDQQGCRWKVPFVMILLGKPVDEVYAFCKHFCKYSPLINVSTFEELEGPIEAKHEEMLSYHYQSQPGKFMYGKASALDDIFKDAKNPQDSNLYFVVAVLTLKRRILSTYIFRCLALKLALDGNKLGKLLAPATGRIEDFVLGSHVIKDQEERVNLMNRDIRKLEDAITARRNFFILLIKGPENDENGELRKKCIRALEGPNKELVLYARKCYQRIPISTAEMAVRMQIFHKGELPIDKEIAAERKKREDAAKKARENDQSENE